MPITISGNGDITGLPVGWLTDGIVTTADLADGAVTTAKIADGTVVPTDLSTGAPSWDTSGSLIAVGLTASGGGINSKSSGNRHLWFQNAAGIAQALVYNEATSGDVIIDVRPNGTPTNAMAVHADGSLGCTASYWRTSSSGGRIRMTTGNLVNFHWNAGFYYNIDNNAWVLINASASDINLKNIESAGVPSALDLVMALNPVRYTYKEDCPIAVSDAPRYGFIAQELQAILPELVQEAGLPKRVPESPDEEIEDPGTYLRYADDASKQLIAVLTAALQEAVNQIHALETRISALEANS